MNYEHTQRSPLHVLLYLFAALMLGAAWFAQDQPAAIWALFSAALLLMFIAQMFRHLTIRDAGDQLSVRFGPIPVFGTSIAYDDISEYRAGRSRLIDGWGIHFVPFRGWTINLWGFDCIEMVARGKKIRLGTDDVENLICFLRSRVGAPSDQTPAS